MRSTIVDVYKREGILGFYQGYVALLLREIPANFFYFGGYECMKDLLRSPGEEEDIQLATWKVIVSGGFGGVTYWCSIYPIDVLKTKLQVYNCILFTFVLFTPSYVPLPCPNIQKVNYIVI